MIFKKNNIGLNKKVSEKLYKNTVVSVDTLEVVDTQRSVFSKLLCSFFIMAFLLAFTTPAQATEFPLDHWAAVDMLELRARGVLDDEEINPEAFVTRGEFTKMLVTALDLKLDAWQLQGVPSSFHDVPNDYPLKGYINAARERGLVGGYTPTIFRPEEELERVQMIVLLLRVMGLDELKGDKEELDFRDVDHIPDYAVASVCEGVRLGLVKGDIEKTLRPTDKVTVAEAAAFINRWLELKGDRYDYIGNYVSVDLEGNLLSVQVGDDIIAIPLADSLQIIWENKLISWEQLEENTPIAVKLNVFGEAIFIQVRDVELSDVKISLNTRKLPKLHADPSNYVEVTKNQSPEAEEKLPVTSHQSLVTNNLFNARLPMDLDNIQKAWTSLRQK